MRLIDADKLPYVNKVILVDKSDGDVIITIAKEYTSYVNDETPTVKAIPIDKPFLKMRYGDYVVYNKKWLVNHLQTEWNILQGKEYQPSIPIEWLKRWFETQIWRGSSPTDRIRCKASDIIEDWEQEQSESLE